MRKFDEIDQTDAFVRRKTNVFNTSIVMLIIDFLIGTFFFVFTIINIINWNNPGVGAKDARPVNRMLFFIDLALTLMMIFVIIFEIKKAKSVYKEIKANNANTHPIATFLNDTLVLYDYEGNEYFGPFVASMYHKSHAIHATINSKHVFLGWFISKEEYNKLLEYLSR